AGEGAPGRARARLGAGRVADRGESTVGIEPLGELVAVRVVGETPVVGSRVGGEPGAGRAIDRGLAVVGVAERPDAAGRIGDGCNAATLEVEDDLLAARVGDLLAGAAGVADVEPLAVALALDRGQPAARVEQEVFADVRRPELVAAAGVVELGARAE